MTIIARSNASGGSDIIVACVSFVSAAWSSPIHVCQGYDDLTVTLETDEQVTFLACDFQYKLPDIDSAANVSMSMALDGLIDLGDGYGNKTVIQMADEARVAGEDIDFELRFYFLDDLSAPQLEPERMKLAPYEFDVLTGQFNVSAVYYDFVNKAWPVRSKNYSIQKYTGLKYYA